jgi:hypothetical protein
MPGNRREPRMMAAVMWVLGLCLCVSEMLQSWIHQQRSPPLKSRALRHENAATGSDNSSAAVLLHACTNRVRKRFDFAFVVVLESSNRDEQRGTIALGNSLAGSGVRADMLLLQVVGMHTAFNHSHSLVEGGGWAVCIVEEPESLAALSGDHRLKAWALTEYKAVAIMEPDTLVVGDVSVLFTVHYEAMRRMTTDKKSRNMSVVGAVQRQFTPCPPHETARRLELSTGVLLVLPSFVEYLRLRKHALTSRQQGLRRLLQTLPLYPLPPELNANIAWQFCNARWWASANLRILHFTIAKPWNYDGGTGDWFAALVDTRWTAQHPWACWLTGTETLCELWQRHAGSVRPP